MADAATQGVNPEIADEALSEGRTDLEAYPDVETLVAEMRELAGAANQITARAIVSELRLRASIEKLARTGVRPIETPSPHPFPKMTAAEFRDLLTRKEVAKEIGVCTVTLKKMYEEGRFPEPIQLSSRKLRFRRSDIDRWIRGDDDRY